MAVRGMSGVPLLVPEAPAVAALDARPLPRQLPLRATALGLLTRSGEPRVSVVVTAEASTLTFRPNTTNDAFVTDFTILADQGRAGRGRAEGQRALSAEWPHCRHHRAHNGEILFFRQPELPPGAYMLEAAVHDAMASAAGARFVPFTVHEPSPHGLLVSSLVLVQRTERAGDVKPEDTNPLVTGDQIVYPRLGEPYKRALTRGSRSSAAEGAGTGGAPSATLVLLRNGQAAATLPLPLPAPDAQGVIDHSAQLPLEALPLGDFTFRLVVKGAGDEVVREVPLRVVE